MYTNNLALSGYWADRVKAWKSGGIKGAMKETGKIGGKALTAVATGGTSLFAEGANLLKQLPTATPAAVQNLAPLLTTGQPSNVPAAQPGKLDFSNPAIKYGAIAAGALIVLMMLKK